MQDSDQIYDELIRRLEEAAAPIAAQVREEVARGRLIKGSALPEEERLQRQDRLAEAKLSRISSDEMAVLPYSGDQRLALLCDTLLTMAVTMTECRRVVLELATSHELPSTLVEFVEPDEAEAVTFDLHSELFQAEGVVARVRDLVEPVRQEVGTWH